LIDEFGWNDFIPWQISLSSALAISDEVIVVKGNRRYSCKGESIADFVKKLSSPKLKMIDYEWPETFSWFDIAHALNTGLLHCSHEWCFRLLMDEIIPIEQFRGLIKILKNCNEYDVLRVGRYYQLGERYVYPYIQKELFFRNHSAYAYGRVAPDKQGALLFDNPIRLKQTADFFKLTPESYRKRFATAPPLGERESYSGKVRNLELFMINTDVNYLPDHLLIEQKRQSIRGYLNLPAEYRRLYQTNDSDGKILKGHLAKVGKMLKQTQKLQFYKIPEDLMGFVRQFGAEQNSVQCLIRKFLPHGGKIGD
jgi:glycosyltransferase involved in cell wall biosynthesis